MGGEEGKGGGEGRRRREEMKEGEGEGVGGEEKRGDEGRGGEITTALS